MAVGSWFKKFTRNIRLGGKRLCATVGASIANYSHLRAFSASTASLSRTNCAKFMCTHPLWHAACVRCCPPGEDGVHVCECLLPPFFLTPSLDEAWTSAPFVWGPPQDHRCEMQICIREKTSHSFVSFSRLPFTQRCSWGGFAEKQGEAQC